MRLQNEKMPGLPVEIIRYIEDRGGDISDLRGLWSAVLLEVTDDDYLHRSHHNVGTYDAGCRGALCTKALREHPKRKRPDQPNERAERMERAYDPVLEYFFTVAKFRLREDINQRASSA